MTGKQTIKSFQKSFSRCTNYAQASKVMETLQMGPAAHTNAELYFAVDPAQADVRTKLLTSIYQEAQMKMKTEEEEKPEEKTEEEEDEEPEKPKTEEEEEDDEDEDDMEEEEEEEVKEFEGGQSKISSKPGMENLSMIGDRSTAGAGSDDKFPNPQNQMKEMLKYLPKSQRKQFLEALRKSGAYDTLNQASHLNATLREAVRQATGPLLKEIKVLKLGYQALDKKINETQNKQKSMTLNIQSPTPMFATPHHSTRETLVDASNGYIRPKSIKEATDEARNDIAQINDAMNSGLIPKEIMN